MPFEHLDDRVVITHSKGASAEILLYGATIISWKSANRNCTPVERLFVSSKAKLDGTKAVRGGIPIVFPCFGAPVHPEHLRLSQHGFARNHMWQWQGIVMDNDAGVSAKFSLNPMPVIQAIYNHSFCLHYIVTVAEHQISTDLHVENTSTGDMEFQALFHNYIRAPSDDVVVTPLQELVYYDKTNTSADGQPKQKVESRAAVDVRQGTDSIYENAPQDYEIKWGSSGIRIKTVNLKDVVVWNPQDEGRKLADMEEGGWKNYICVEPGFVKGFVKLHAGERWIGQQVLSVMDESEG